MTLLSALTAPLSTTSSLHSASSLPPPVSEFRSLRLSSCSLGLCSYFSSPLPSFDQAFRLNFLPPLLSSAPCTALTGAGSRDMEGPLGEIPLGIPERSAQAELLDGDQNLIALQEQVSILEHRIRSLETRLQQRSYMGLLSATALKMYIDTNNRMKITIDILSKTREEIEDLSSQIKSLDEEKQNLEVIFQKTKKEARDCHEKKKRLMRMLRDGKGKGMETDSEQIASTDKNQQR